MRAGLIFSITGKFMRSRSLALSTIATFAAAAVLVAMFISMKAFTLSSEQVVDRDLGRFSSQLDLSNLASLKPGDTRLPRALASSARSAGGHDVTVSLSSFDIRPDAVSPPLVLYFETDWSTNPFPHRYTLTQGRWPAKPGEVVLTQRLKAAVGNTNSISALSGNEHFNVVGAAIDKFDSFARILAAEGTWEAFHESTQKNFSTVLATATLQWNGESEQVVEAVGAALLHNKDLVAAASPDEIASQLARGTRTRSAELAQTRRSWIERLPLAYQIPSLALPLVSVLAVFGLNNRRFRKSWRVLTSIGMSRSTAISGVVLAAGAWTIISALLGGLIGIGLGFVARPICDHFLAGPISPFPNVISALLQVLSVTTFSCLLIGSVLLVGWRSVGIGNKHSIGQRKPSDTRGDNSRKSALRISGVLTQARRFGALAAGFAVVAQAVALDTVPKAMILAATLGLVVLLCTPELVDITIRLIPTKDPRSRLGHRQLAHDKDRAIAGVAVLAAVLGAPLSMLTLLATLISSAEAERIPAVAPHQVVLSSPAGSFFPPSPDVVEAVTDRVAFSAPPVQTGYLWSDTIKVTVQDSGIGTVLVVASVSDASRLNNAPLSADQSETLQKGGMLVWDGDVHGRRALLLHDANDRVISTTESLTTTRIDFQTPWDVSTSGLILSATAQQLRQG